MGHPLSHAVLFLHSESIILIGQHSAVKMEGRSSNIFAQFTLYLTEAKF